MSNCDICGLPVIDISTYGRDANLYDCKRCGRVSISGTMSAVLLNNKEYDDIKYILSGITRYRTDNNLEPVMIYSDNIKSLMDSYFVPRSISQKIDLLLKYLGKKSEYPGRIIDINPSNDYPIAFCKDPDELRFYFSQLIAKGLLERVDIGYKSRLTIDGWNRLDDLNRTIVKKNQAFIAMWFDDSLFEIYDKGFSKALKDCGFEPIRIDLKEHNNKIDEEIIAEIRNSAFIVADFTGQRGGVYFEAGFAMGLGIPVIWTCNKEHLKGLHFDTRQFNHIEWTEIDELYKKLSNRINATINK